MGAILTEKLRVNVVDASDCKYPIHLRWMNKWGGIDYWTFYGRKTMNFNTSDEVQYNPFIEDNAVDQAIVETLRKEGRTSFLVVADHLSDKEVVGLRGLLESPWVSGLINQDDFNVESSEWQRVQIATGAFEIGDTGRALYSLSLNVILQPNINVWQ